jgi:hypothetical protein
MNEPVQVYDGDSITPYEKDLREKMQKVSDEIYNQVMQKEELRRHNAQRLAAKMAQDMVDVQPMGESIGMAFALRNRSPGMAIDEIAPQNRVPTITGLGADHVVAEDPVGSTPGSSPVPLVESLRRLELKVDVRSVGLKDVAGLVEHLGGCS